MATRGFQGRRRQADDRVPPGQYVTDDFPVLTAGPTIDLSTTEWELTITDGIASKTYDWAALHQFELTELTTDIHCVTHWTKLGTTWAGVPISTLFDDAGVGDFDFALVSSYGDYTTNLPVIDLTEHDAMIAARYDGAEIEAEHGGPARLLVPHLYLWKSAKWVREIRLADQEDQGFWEAAGYHNYGDPWREQRYYSD
ncbi:MAG: molybdopterin-dependent oxidoreductase [Acidimicrobiales bacterium]